MNALSRTISYLFNPAIMPTVAIMIILNSHTVFRLMFTNQAKWALGLVVFIFTFALPVLSLIGLHNSGKVSHFMLPGRRERLLPQLLATAYFIMGYLIIRSTTDIVLLHHILIAGVMSMVVTLVITVWYKISIHTIGMGSFAGLITGLSAIEPLRFDFVIFPIILVSGLVGMARMHLNAHCWHEVLTGFLAGFFTQYMVLMFLSG
jgi:hypothetical protein